MRLVQPENTENRFQHIMTSYFVLWIPVLQKGDLKIRNKELDKILLKDLPDVQELYIKGTIDSAFNITFEYWLTEKDKHNYIFKCVEKRQTGFLAYEVEIDENATDFVSNGLREGLHKSFYHYIKGFFHNHVHHEKSEDSLLACYFSNTPISLSNKQNFRKVVDSYLDCYIQKLKGNISETNSLLTEVLDDMSQGKGITKNIKFLHALIKNCYHIKGELGYCRFLSDTNLNESSKEKRDELKARCVEFDSSLDNLLFWYNHYVALVSFTAGGKSLNWGIAGTTLGALSLIVTAGLEIRNSFQMSNKDLLDSIGKKDSLRDRAFDKEIDGLHLLFDKCNHQDSIQSQNKPLH